MVPINKESLSKTGQAEAEPRKRAKRRRYGGPGSSGGTPTGITS